MSVPLEHLQLFSSVVCGQLARAEGGGRLHAYVVARVAVAGNLAEAAAKLDTRVLVGIAQRRALFGGDLAGRHGAAGNGRVAAVLGGREAGQGRGGGDEGNVAHGGWESINACGGRRQWGACHGAAGRAYSVI